MLNVLVHLLSGQPGRLIDRVRGRKHALWAKAVPDATETTTALVFLGSKAKRSEAAGLKI
jgi:hypothetical protein